MRIWIDERGIEWWACASCGYAPGDGCTCDHDAELELEHETRLDPERVVENMNIKVDE